MSTRCCTTQARGGRQLNRVVRGTPAPAPSRRRLPQESVVRNEFKYDLFGSDLPDVISVIERDHKEIKRPTPTTLTLYFYDAELGAPEVDPFYRLRTYAHFDPDATSLDDIKALPWQVQKKCGHEKRPLGTLEGLPASIAPDDEVWELLGETRRPNLLKVSQRRHFAVDETHDESQRITVDLSRSVFKIVDQRLVPLGDIGPRVEVKLPAGQPEDSLPMARRLRGASYWMPVGTIGGRIYRAVFSTSHVLLPLSVPIYSDGIGVRAGNRLCGSSQTDGPRLLRRARQRACFRWLQGLRQRASQQASTYGPDSLCLLAQLEPCDHIFVINPHSRGVCVGLADVRFGPMMDWTESLVFSNS